MKNLLLCTITAVAVSSGAASAEAMKTSFFTNDFIGDGHDRWRSGSYTTYWGYEGDWTGGVGYDLRFRSEIISPWGSSDQAQDDDRPYVGMLGFGAFANERIGLTDLNFGGEFLIVGDQTGLSKLQNGFHKVFGFDGYMPEDDTHPHIEDAFTGMISGEVANNYFVGTKGSIRPFVGAQFGYETFMRAGVDFLWGNHSYAERFVRDPVTGFVQPSSTARASAMEGFSLLAGLDYTAVTSSDFLPDTADVEMEPGRIRARIGMQGKIGPASVFYGATHMTKEFTSQVEGQTVGTLSVSFPF